jgi:hypothetical protein
MGAFNINITGVGGHGCERKAKAGDKLYGRCGRFSCPDCAAYDFTQRLRQAGMLRDDEQAYNVELSVDDPLVVDYLRHKQDHEASQALVTPRIPELPPYRGPVWQSDQKFYRKMPQQALFTHWPDSPTAVVDDMLKNERVSGNF